MEYVITPIEEVLGLRKDESPAENLMSCCKTCGTDGTEDPDHRAKVILDNARFEVNEQIDDMGSYLYKCIYCERPLLRITVSCEQ